MSGQDMKQVVGQTAALLEGFHRRTRDIDDRVEATRQSVDHLSQRVPEVIRRSVDAVVSKVPDRVAQDIRSRMDDVTATYERRLREASDDTRQAAEGVSKQLARLERLHRHLVWKVAGAVGGALVVLSVGAVLLGWHYKDIIHDNRIQAELMQAYNAADVRLCDGVLCANVDTKGHKFGEHGEYRPIRPR